MRQLCQEWDRAAASDGMAYQMKADAVRIGLAKSIAELNDREEGIVDLAAESRRRLERDMAYRRFVQVYHQALPSKV